MAENSTSKKSPRGSKARLRGQVTDTAGSIIPWEEALRVTADGVDDVLVTRERWFDYVTDDRLS